MPAVNVIGLGVRSPFGVGAGSLLEGLLAGRPAFAPHEPFARAGLKYPVAAALPAGCLDDPNAGLAQDRGTRMLEAAIRDALHNATGSCDLASLDVTPSRIGLVVGTSSGGIGAFCNAIGGQSPVDGAAYASGAQYVARTLGVRGPVAVVCTVCASGAQAIAEAAAWIDVGEVDVAIAAGYDPLEPFVGAGFDALAALADRPRPFRAQRTGLVLGEASAAMILSAHNSTAQRAHGSIAGWGYAADAFHLTAPHPDGLGLALAIERALQHAAVDRSQVAVVNAHGTSTLYNDRMEARALERVFGPRAGDRAVYTVKGTIGHTLGAAGAVEAVVALAAMAQKTIPPTCTEGDLDPECPLDVVSSPRPSDATMTLSLSAGFGGVNCALLLSVAPANQAGLR